MSIISCCCDDDGGGARADPEGDALGAAFRLSPTVAQTWSPTARPPKREPDELGYVPAGQVRGANYAFQVSPAPRGRGAEVHVLTSRIDGVQSPEGARLPLMRDWSGRELPKLLRPRCRLRRTGHRTFHADLPQHPIPSRSPRSQAAAPGARAVTLIGVRRHRAYLSGGRRTSLPVLGARVRHARPDRGTAHLRESTASSSSDSTFAMSSAYRLPRKGVVTRPPRS